MCFDLKKMAPNLAVTVEAPSMDDGRFFPERALAPLSMPMALSIESRFALS